MSKITYYQGTHMHIILTGSSNKANVLQLLEALEYKVIQVKDL